MLRRGNGIFACLATGLALCSWSGMANAAPNKSAASDMKAGRSTNMNGLNDMRFSRLGGGQPVHGGTPRGEVIHSGLPACDDGGICDDAVGITGDFDNSVCPGNDWLSLAFPVVTDGATITSVNITHLSADVGGHLFLMDDCAGQPDTFDILYSGCNQILAGNVGAFSYDVGAVATGATTWVVAVFQSSFSFDIAFNTASSDGLTTGLAFGNLSGDGANGEWQDLADFELGFCYCVSVTAGEGGPACCDAAQCDGDANGDGEVDPLDTGFASARFGLDVTSGDNCQADVNCDGEIDPLDTGYISARFGLCNPPILCAPGGGDCGGGGDPPAPPANDGCSSAAVVLEGTTAFDNTLATTDGPADCTEFTGNNDLWYQYTATGAGTLLVSTCDVDFDSTLSVYSGSGCPVGASLACSDDDCGVVGGGSELSISVTNGQVIKIRVGGFDNDDCTLSNPTGAGNLFLDLIATTQGACCFEDETCTINTSAGCTGGGGVFQGNGTACTANLCAISGENDTCDGAVIQDVSIGQTVSFTGDSTDATIDCTGGAEVWEAFNLTELADVEIDYCGTPLEGDFLFIVIMDSCGAAGECGSFIFADPPSVGLRACGDDTFASLITFPGLPAGDYYIPVLADADGIQGPYTVNVTAVAPAAECCEVHATPGCDDPIIEACVCAVDDFCCNVTWDEACVDLVEIAGCGSCTVGCETADPPNDACECAAVVPIANDQTITFLGDTTGAGQECDELGAGITDVWLAFSIDATDRVFVDYCGTTTPFDFLFIVADNSCPCDGTFIFGTQVTVTCDDATQAAGLRFTNLPAGTYYYPLLAGDLGVDGPYSMRVGRR